MATSTLNLVQLSQRELTLNKTLIQKNRSQTLSIVKAYIKTIPVDVLYEAAYTHLTNQLNLIQLEVQPFKPVYTGSSESIVNFENVTLLVDLSKQQKEIIIQNSSNFILDFQNIFFQCDQLSRPKFILCLHNCKNFVIKNVRADRCRNFCIITNSSYFIIKESSIENSEGYGIIIHDSSYFIIQGCSFERNLASGILCNGETRYGLIKQNIFSKSQGYFNWDASLHINHCSKDFQIEALPELAHEPMKIIKKLKKPKFLFVEDNIFLKNQAQGIYCEGCLLSVFRNNVISHNNKEGICFDWGSGLNWFENNEVSNNGERAKMTEEEIKADFINDFPMLEDGSSSCKLPGISMDNAAANYIINNKIQNNYGGGVKFVRSSIANVIKGNTFYENGIGTNQHFQYYHAVICLGMGAFQNEFEEGKDDLLNFLPSFGNIISANLFHGKSHHHSIYADELSSDNLIYEDNSFVQCGFGISHLSPNLLLQK